MARGFRRGTDVAVLFDELAVDAAIAVCRHQSVREECLGLALGQPATLAGV